MTMTTASLLARARMVRWTSPTRLPGHGGDRSPPRTTPGSDERCPAGGRRMGSGTGFAGARWRRSTGHPLDGQQVRRMVRDQHPATRPVRAPVTFRSSTSPSTSRSTSRSTCRSASSSPSSSSTFPLVSMPCPAPEPRQTEGFLPQLRRRHRDVPRVHERLRLRVVERARASAVAAGVRRGRRAGVHAAVRPREDPRAGRQFLGWFVIRHEIDLLAEVGTERAIGIEVKATSAPDSSAAMHLTRLRDRLAEQFVAGVLLHTGPTTFSFGGRIVAAPISTLWA